jgi:predicted Ser/Thr protein kinase
METIGRYQIVRELGRGAGGVVYLAEDPKIGRRVAIKTISAAGGANETLRKRLQREARSAGAIAHRNIVTVYEMDDEGSLTYVVMEFVEGKTLRALMQESNRLPSPQIIAILKQVAEGLDFAHGRNVVHRDIKPANIMIAEGDLVKIADFGVAKMLGDATVGLTQAGMAVGTPHYMAPEQVLGKPVDGRTDQFALGVIAYELLSGRRPFEGDSITSIMYQIVNEDPVREDTTSSIVSLPALPSLLRALAKEPAQRYPTCSEFIQDLEQGLTNPRGVPLKIEPLEPPPPAPATPPPPPQPAAPPVQPPAPQQPAPAAVDAQPPAYAAPLPPGRSQGRKILIGVATAVLVIMAILVYHAKTAVPAAAPQTESPASPAPAAAPPVAQAQTPAPAPAKPVPTAPPKVKTSSPETAHAETASAKVPAPAPSPKEGGGSFTWSGTLANGDSIEITGNEATDGAVSGPGLPRHTPVIVTVDPPDVAVNEAPSAGNGYKLILVNEGRTISSITISWRKARRGETQE